MSLQVSLPKLVNTPLLYDNNDISKLHLMLTGHRLPVSGSNPLGTSIDIINELDELILLISCMISWFSNLFRPYPNIQSIMQSYLSQSKSLIRCSQVQALGLIDGVYHLLDVFQH